MLGTTPFLWFDTQAEDAARYYTSVFPNSRVTRTTRNVEGGAGEAGTVLVVDFELDGRPFSALNGGPHVTFDEAVSFVVRCEDQAEVDHYWAALTEGGSESECGWCKDRFGLSWQVVPVELFDLLADPDPARAARATQAMLHMVKLDLAALRAAADAG